MQRAGDGKETLVLVVILGSGILVGLLSRTLLLLILASLLLGIALNAYLLVALALRADKVDKVWVAALGALPAGVYDAAKIFGIALAVWWGTGLLMESRGGLLAGLLVLHVGLLMAAFLIVLNGFLQGSLKAYIDVALSCALGGLLVATFWAYGWKAGLAAIAFSFLYAIATRPVARATAKWLLSHPPVSGVRPPRLSG